MGDSRYEVSDEGQVRHARKQRLLKPFLHRGGYLLVNIGRRLEHQRTKHVHMLVARAFLGEPPQPPPGRRIEVNHLNGDKSDCSVGNLEWTTSKANADHAVAMGLRRKDPQTGRFMKVLA